MPKQKYGGRNPGKWLAAGASAACLAVTVIAAALHVVRGVIVQASKPG